MNWLFDKRFIYNRSVNSDDPGLADFFVFLLKYLPILSLLVLMLSVVVGDFALAAMICGAAMEEQGLVFWIYHARRPLKAGLKFAICLSIFEVFSYGFTLGGAHSASSILELLSLRAAPSARHLLSALMAYALIKRQMPVVRVWLICAAFHIAYNFLIWALS